MHLKMQIHSGNNLQYTTYCVLLNTLSLFETILWQSKKKQLLILCQKWKFLDINILFIELVFTSSVNCAVYTNIPMAVNTCDTGPIFCKNSRPADDTGYIRYTLIPLFFSTFHTNKFKVHT